MAFYAHTAELPDGSHAPENEWQPLATHLRNVAKLAKQFASPLGLPAEAELAYGDPVTEIVRWVQHKGCDLVAMSTHGHRFLADIFLGATASRVQHSIDVPVLLIRAR